MVPTLILQPLVENALRHGIAKKASAGRITISARRDRDELVLTVLDDGPGIGGQISSRDGSLGVANVRSRLAALYGGRGTLTVADAEGRSGAIATIRLPYREAPGGAAHG